MTIPLCKKHPPVRAAPVRAVLRSIRDLGMRRSLIIWSLGDGEPDLLGYVDASNEVDSNNPLEWMISALWMLSGAGRQKS